jgi:RNA polymerase sigma-70 factor (ECF subfamily)
MPVPVPNNVVASPGVPPSSFEEAYRDYAQRTARWAQLLGGADVDVEDVVQEVFFVVSRKLAAFQGEGTFTSWLFDVTRKIVANHRRRQAWRFWRSAPEVLERVPSLALGPDAELERHRLRALLFRALDRLPEHYRAVFVLYEIEGQSTHAISELCRLNLSTVKVQLARARHRFIEAYRRQLRRDASPTDATWDTPDRLLAARLGKGKL